MFHRVVVRIQVIPTERPERVWGVAGAVYAAGLVSLSCCPASCLLAPELAPSPSFGTIPPSLGLWSILRPKRSF